MDGGVILEVRGLVKRCGDGPAIDGLDLSPRAGTLCLAADLALGAISAAP